MLDLWPASWKRKCTVKSCRDQRRKLTECNYAYIYIYPLYRCIILKVVERLNGIRNPYILVEEYLQLYILGSASIDGGIHLAKLSVHGKWKAHWTWWICHGWSYWTLPVDCLEDTNYFVRTLLHHVENEWLVSQIRWSQSTRHYILSGWCGVPVRNFPQGYSSKLGWSWQCPSANTAWQTTITIEANPKLAISRQYTCFPILLLVYLPCAT